MEPFARPSRLSGFLTRNISVLSHLGCFEWDIQTDQLSWSEELYRIYGVDPAEFTPSVREFMDRVHGDDRERVAGEISRLLAEGGSFHLEERIMHGDGSVRVLESWGQTVTDADGTVLRLVGVCVDITERRRANEELERTQRFIARISDASPLVIYVFDVASQALLYANERLVKVLRRMPGSPEFVDHEFLRENIHPDDLQRLPGLLARWQSVSDSDILETEYRLRDASGGWMWFLSRDTVFARDTAGRVTQIIGTAQDITKRRQLEDQLRHAQKMEAIGRLAGGIAHDFNNLLTVINGYSELVLAALEAQDPLCDSMNAIIEAGQRASRLTHQLLAFSRKALLAPEPLDLNQLVMNLDRLLRRIIGEHIDLQTALNAELPAVFADRSQLEQVVMNIVINARDAMPDGGRIRITTSIVDALDPVAAEIAAEHVSGLVRLSIADTGEGMSQEVLARAFEPFFTTREAGSRGLGLSVVHGIMEQCGGRVQIDSAPGEGTTFHLLLPSVAGESAVADAASDKATDPGHGSVLLVEDDAAVRTVTRMTLESLGYTVTDVACGADAIRLAAETSFRILLSDMVMPDMSGREVVAEVRRRQPGILVLFMSGYADDQTARPDSGNSRDLFLQKPFSRAHLAARLKELNPVTESSADGSAAISGTNASPEAGGQS